MQVCGHYIVQVRVNGYSNPTGKCYDQNSCDSSPNSTHCCDGACSSNSSCEEQSDSYFIYCLRPLGTERRLGYHPNEIRTNSSVNENDGDIDFSDSIVLGLSNPLYLTGLDTAYKVSKSMVSLCTSVI